MKLEIREYLNIQNQELDESLRLLNIKDYTNCKIILNRSIDSIRTILVDRPWGKYNDYYNNILIFGIIFKCILDLLEIIELTSNKDWVRKNKTIEDIWSKLHDCKDRLYYIKNHTSDDFFNFIDLNLQNLERVFKHNYGESLYMSVEFVYEPICNVCLKDIRACEHEANSIYNGVLCKIMRKGLKMKCSNVVNEPHDYRCRIWPWNIDTKENNESNMNSTFEAPIFTFFTVDNFLDDSTKF